jgi:hypothetical protein
MTGLFGSIRFGVRRTSSVLIGLRPAGLDSVQFGSHGRARRATIGARVVGTAATRKGHGWVAKCDTLRQSGRKTTLCRVVRGPRSLWAEGRLILQENEQAGVHSALAFATRVRGKPGRPPLDSVQRSRTPGTKVHSPPGRRRARCTTGREGWPVRCTIGAPRDRGHGTGGAPPGRGE